MTDDFDKLRAGLKAALPAPDAAAKAATLARAMENFDRAQGIEASPRPMSDRPQRTGILTGVRAMLSNLATRPALAATASVAALCVGLVVVLPALRQEPGLPKPVSIGTTEVKKEAPLARTAPLPEDAARAKSAEPAPATVEARTDPPSPLDAAAGAEVADAVSEPVMEVAPSADALADSAPSLGGALAVEQARRAQDSVAASQAAGALSDTEADLGYAAQAPAPAEALVRAPEAEFTVMPEPNTEATAMCRPETGPAAPL